MQSVPASRQVPRAEVRSQEMRPISDLNFSETQSGAESQEMPSASRYTRSGSITANYYGDESVNVGAASNNLNRQNSNQSFGQSIQVGKKHSRQSRRLPYWIWFVLAKSLGIKLAPNDKPIFGTFMHVLTLIFALGFGITFTWHKVYDIVSEYTKETVLKGAVAILMTVYWCCLGVYANQLASKLFRNPKFIDSVRLHTKTIFKVSAGGIMVFLGITVIILHCIDTIETFRPNYCHKVRISPIVCRVMYVMKVGCVCISLLWNLLVGIVLLSVCRTHTIGIRRFIRELEIDGKLYELHLRRQNPKYNQQEDEHFQHEALWDHPIDANRDELWENLTVEEILSDSSTEEDAAVPPGGRATSASCPTSPVMLRPARNLGTTAVGVSFSLPRGQGPDSNFYDTLRNRHSRRSDDSGDMRNMRHNPFDTMEDALGDSAVRDYFTANDASAEAINDVLLLEENYYEKDDAPGIEVLQENGNSNNNANKQTDTDSGADPEGQGQREKSNNGRPLRSEKDVTVWRFLSVDDIYLSYWKISCRLRFTSIALQRWLLGFMMYIILWSFTYIIYWVKHEASMMDIALFLIPILILPIVCSAYGEVNYEGKRMLRCICPTSERTEMLQTLFQQPLELNAFGFAISYQVIGGALGALAVAFCTRLVLDEIGSS